MEINPVVASMTLPGLDLFRALVAAQGVVHAPVLCSNPFTMQDLLSVSHASHPVQTVEHVIACNQRNNFL